MFTTQSILLAASCALGSSAAMAANYQGTISNVTPFNGKVFVIVSGGGFDGPSGTCPSGSSMIYSADPSTIFGRTLVAVALSAKLSGRLVYAIGDGVCTGGSPFPNGVGEGLLGVDLKG